MKKYLSILLLTLLFSCKRETPVEPDPSASDVHLAPPPAGQGVQVSIAPFTVKAGEELQRNYYTTLPSDSDIYITKVQFSYNPGSHHCNVFRTDSVKKTDGTYDETFKSVDYTMWNMFAASQKENFVWQLPPGIAIKLKGKQQLLIQTHYVNGGSQLSPNGRGKVLINFWTIPKSQVTNEVGLIFASNTLINIPPKDSLTVRKFVKKIPNDINILAMTGHFHSRGVSFWAQHYEANFKEIYRNTAWSEPPIKVFGAPEYPSTGYVLPKNQQIAYYTSYYNSTNDTVKMGPHVLNEEHSNLFLFFWPAPADGKTIYDIDQGW
ncbi:MAG: hypothetical protein WDA22_07195 [Bacteroidota bacterium]